jgi:hypothetical protein
MLRLDWPGKPRFDRPLLSPLHRNPGARSLTESRFDGSLRLRYQFSCEVGHATQESEALEIHSSR